jgi:hypothetical protein
MSFFPRDISACALALGPAAASVPRAGWLLCAAATAATTAAIAQTQARSVTTRAVVTTGWLAGWLAGWLEAWQWHQRWAPDGRLSWAVKSRRGVGSHLVGGANCRRYCRLARAARGRSGKCDSGSRLCAAGGRCESPSVRQSASLSVCRPTGTMMTHNIEPNY